MTRPGAPYDPGRMWLEPGPEPAPPRSRGGGCWALVDRRGAYWDGSKHISGLPMTTIMEERAYRFPSAELASVANLTGFEPVRIFEE